MTYCRYYRVEYLGEMGGWLCLIQTPSLEEAEKVFHDSCERHPEEIVQLTRVEEVGLKQKGGKP